MHPLKLWNRIIKLISTKTKPNHTIFNAKIVSIISVNSNTLNISRLRTYTSYVIAA